ncbi:TPA: FGGY family carbohydrate kinase [Streptococcus suis]
MDIRNRPVISIDLGTTAIKMTLFDEDRQSQQYFHYRLRESIIEGDRYALSWPEIWQAVQEGLMQLRPSKAYDILLTSAMHSLVLLDQTMTPTSDLMTWADNRAKNQVVFPLTDHDLSVYQRTGTPIHAMTPYVKLLWFKDQGLIPANCKIGSVKDLLFYHLTEDWAIDVSNASATGLYEWTLKQWDPMILKELDIQRDALPSIVPIDHTMPLNPSLNLGQARVVIGSSDGVSATAVHQSINKCAVLSIGTSSAVRVIMNQPILNPQLMNFAYTINDGSFLVGLPSNTGGNVLDWICRQHELSYDQMLEIVAKRPISQAVFLPYVFGERAPLWRSQTQPMWLMKDGNLSQEETVYAQVCGVFYHIAYLLDQLALTIDFTNLAVTGGGLSSPILLSLLCDILNRQILVAQRPALETFGSLALLTAHPLDLAIQTLSPDPTASRLLQANYETFKAGLMHLLKKGAGPKNTKAKS